MTPSPGALTGDATGAGDDAGATGTEADDRHIPARDQLGVWTAIGTQSLGGGSATLYLMRRMLIDGRRWVTAQEFVEDWTLSRLSPGVTLIALTALLGRRIGGRRGVALSIGGLLVPAALITALITGVFSVIAGRPEVMAALAGMGPVTIGMMLGLTVFMARSAMRQGPDRIFDLAVVTVAVVLGFLLPFSPVVMLLAGAAFGALFLGQGPAPETPDEG